MLILVGVTINFALNGGIINKAKQASSQMQIEADREALLSCVIASMGLDGKVDFTDLDREVATIGFTGSNGTYTSKAGNIFTVDENGNITYTGEGNGSGSGTENADLAYLRTYIGQNLEDIADMSNLTFNDSNITLDESFDGSPETDGNGNMILPIRYKGNLYSFVVDGSGLNILNVVTGYNPANSGSGSESDSDSSSESVNGNTGKSVTYGGIDYIIFAEDTTQGTVDLISENALGNVTLGDSNSFSDSVTSYNNMVETLVTECKNETGLTVDGTDVISIRSVGNENVKYTSTGIMGTDNPGTYTYDWQGMEAESDWYTENGYNNSYNIKAGDENYQSDLSTMQTLGITQANNSTEYWMASRVVFENSKNVNFDARFMRSDGSLNYCPLFLLNSYDNIHSFSESYAVRPIITLNSSVIAEYLD